MHHIITKVLLQVSFFCEYNERKIESRWKNTNSPAWIPLYPRHSMAVSWHHLKEFRWQSCLFQTTYPNKLEEPHPRNTQKWQLSDDKFLFLEQSQALTFGTSKALSGSERSKSEIHLFDTASFLCSSWFVFLRNLNLWIPPKPAMWSTLSIDIYIYRMYV